MLFDFFQRIEFSEDHRMTTLVLQQVNLEYEFNISNIIIIYLCEDTLCRCSWESVSYLVDFFDGVPFAGLLQSDCPHFAKSSHSD